MEFQLHVLDCARNNFRKLLEDVTREEMLAIPAGFNNNILWNIGHVLSSQQALVYLLSGLPARVPDSLMAYFRKGTSPAGWPSPPDTAPVLEHLWETPVRLRQDLEAGLFRVYKGYETSFGTKLASVEEAIAFANVHEALHFGVVSSLKKTVRQQAAAQA